MILELSDIDEDLHAQIAIWLLARIVNLIHGASTSDLSQRYEELQDLKLATAAWENLGSVASRAILYRAPDLGADLPFPRILFLKFQCR